MGQRIALNARALLIVGLLFLLIIGDWL